MAKETFKPIDWLNNEDKEMYEEVKKLLHTDQVKNSRDLISRCEKMLDILMTKAIINYKHEKELIDEN